MIKFEYTEVVGWKAAIRGMRNPMNSWDQSDSQYCGGQKLEDCERYVNCHMDYCIGKNDLALMKKLRNAGKDERKFMRMLAVYVDITAPLYWWKQFDTYKVGTVSNSCSTMHKIHAKEFTLDDFSHEHLIVSDDVDHIDMVGWLQEQINYLNAWRRHFLDVKNSIISAKPAKEYWWQMIQLLPTSYNQKRTIMLNYEVLANIYKARKNHKLDEWHDMCRWIKDLPYSELITG